MDQQTPWWAGNGEKTHTAGGGERGRQGEGEMHTHTSSFIPVSIHFPFTQCLSLYTHVYIVVMSCYILHVLHFFGNVPSSVRWTFKMNQERDRRTRETDRGIPTDRQTERQIGE